MLFKIITFCPIQYTESQTFMNSIHPSPSFLTLPPCLHHQQFQTTGTKMSTTLVPSSEQSILHPTRQCSTRIPSLPGNPLTCPSCPHEMNFDGEDARDLHYFQVHILKVSMGEHPMELAIVDGGNYSGPLGKRRHVFMRVDFVESRGATRFT